MAVNANLAGTSLYASEMLCGETAIDEMAEFATVKVAVAMADWTCAVTVFVPAGDNPA